LQPDVVADLKACFAFFAVVLGNTELASAKIWYVTVNLPPRLLWKQVVLANVTDQVCANIVINWIGLEVILTFLTTFKHNSYILLTFHLIALHLTDASFLFVGKIFISDLLWERPMVLVLLIINDRRCCMQNLLLSHCVSSHSSHKWQQNNVSFFSC
jgi:hypothetical protein